MPIGDKNTSRIKSNIKLMIDQGAPDEDIDGYLGEEGVSMQDLTPTAAPNVAAGYGSDKAKTLTDQNIPWFDPKNAGGAQPPATTPSEETSLPSFAGRRGMAGKDPGIINAVPEWRQIAMEGVNVLPEIGEKVGSAAGMVAAIPTFAETGGMSAALAPAGAGVGRMAGRALQTPLTQLLLPEAGATVPDYKEMARTGLQGAQGGALDAATMGRASTVFSPKAMSEVEALINPETSASARARNYLTRKNLTPSLENPGEAKDVVANVGKMGIDLAHGEGPGQIQRRVRDLSGVVDEALSEASQAGKAVTKEEAMKPLYAMREWFAKGDSPGYVKKIDNYIKGFNKMHPEAELTPEASQSLKKFIYKTTPAAGFDEAANYNATNAGKRSLGVGFKESVENVGGPRVAKANEEMSKLLQMKPYVTKASEKIQDRSQLGMIGRGAAHARQAASRVAEAVNKSLRNRPNAEAPDLSTMGSPVQSLEALFGNTGYGEPMAGERAAPGSAEGGWQRPVPEGVDEAGRRTGWPGPPVHPDWFEGLKGSVEAENLGKQIDLKDMNAYRTGKMGTPVEVNPRTIRPGIPGPAPQALLPAETGPARNTPAFKDIAIKGLREPGYQTYAPPIEVMGSPVQSQKMLPAPAMEVAPSGAVLTNEDLAVLQNLGSKDPQSAAILKNLLRMQ